MVTPSVPLAPPSRAARSRGSGFVLIEFADVREKEVHNLAVIEKLPTRQHDLIRAILIELAQPCASFVWVHRLISLDSDGALFSVCSCESSPHDEAYTLGPLVDLRQLCQKIGDTHFRMAADLHDLLRARTG